MKFKKGDTVIVRVGKDKGKKGTITKVLREENRVLVDGLNVSYSCFSVGLSFETLVLILLPIMSAHFDSNFVKYLSNFF